MSLLALCRHASYWSCFISCPGEGQFWLFSGHIEVETHVHSHDFWERNCQPYWPTVMAGIVPIRRATGYDSDHAGLLSWPVHTTDAELILSYCLCTGPHAIHCTMYSVATWYRWRLHSYRRQSLVGIHRCWTPVHTTGDKWFGCVCLHSWSGGTSCLLELAL